MEKKQIFSIGFRTFLFLLFFGNIFFLGQAQPNQSEQIIARIGDFVLTETEYESRNLQMEVVYKIQTGLTSLDDQIIGQIRKSTFEQIVNEKRVDQQTQILGLSVSGQEIYNMVYGDNINPMIMQLPVFRNPKTAQFDRSMMLKFLEMIKVEDLTAYDSEAQEQIKRLKVYWQFWEKNLKYNILEDKINAMIYQAFRAVSLDSIAYWGYRINQTDLTPLLQLNKLFSDDPALVLIKNNRNEIKTKERPFVQIPYRSAKFIIADVKPSIEDIKEVEAGIKAIEPEFKNTSNLADFVNEHSDNQYLDCFVSNRLYEGVVKDFINSNTNYLAPVFDHGSFWMAKILGRTISSDSIHARQIVLGLNDQTLAEELLVKLKLGKDFDELALEYSKSDGSSDLGWFREIDAISLGPKFIQACFSAPLNSFSYVITEHSINLIQVTGKTKPIPKIKIALLEMKVTSSIQTRDNAFEKLTNLREANPNSGQFFTAAIKAGYKVHEAPIIKIYDSELDGFPQMLEAVHFVFNNDVGRLSNVLENQDKQLLVIGVTSIN